MRNNEGIRRLSQKAGSHSRQARQSMHKQE